jgi:putative ABC transport system permease protein
MTLFSAALKSLRGRLVTSLLTTCSVALGVALVLSTVLLTRGIHESFIQGTTDFNLIVGAKGSPTQLVLNVIFHIDVPPPNISYTVFEELHGEPRVEVAVPALLGRCLSGFSIRGDDRRVFSVFSVAPWSVYTGCGPFPPR